MNRAARRRGNDCWIAYGDVTHAEAARLFCEYFQTDGLIETCDLDEENRPVFEHIVTMQCDFRVKSIRGEEANR